MKTLKILFGFSTAIMLALCSLALAQRPSGIGGPGRQGQEGPPPRRPGGPDGTPNGRRPPRPRPNGNLDFASIEMLGGGRVVKDLPYTADAVIETVQVLRDGTRILHKSTTAVARDGEGRLRRERKLDAIGPFVTADGPRTLIVIDDPVLGSHFVFDVESKTARKIRNPPPPLDDYQRGEFAEGKVEALGTRDIEGLQAEGTRSTITIPVGKIGNDRALEIVSERWFAPALQAVVLSSHSDPRMGDTVYRLANIKRIEPDASLFRVPSDYTIMEGGPPPPRRPGPGPGMKPAGPPPPNGDGRPF